LPKNFTPPEECPVCGEPVPRGAHACPHCGADERTGWNEEDTYYDGIDLPEAAFEETAPKRRLRRGVAPWMIVVAILVVLAFVLVVL
jgi:hypothetical protein